MMSNSNTKYNFLTDYRRLGLSAGAACGGYLFGKEIIRMDKKNKALKYLPPILAFLSFAIAYKTLQPETTST